jgi:hypothetical protein
LIKSANDLHGAGKLKEARSAIEAAMKIDPADDFIYSVRRTSCVTLAMWTWELKTGDPLDQPIDQPLPDPQGRWIIAIAPGQPAFFLLKPDAKIFKAARIPAPAAIQSACLVAGHFYVATKDPARLIELDLASGKSLQSWNPPAIATSIAVFPSTGTAYFPNRGSIGALNLKTGNAVSTGKDGQTVIGHPAERYLFTAADQGAQARTLLLDVVHVDVGRLNCRCSRCGCSQNC